jgi:hypothetical protein
MPRRKSNDSQRQYGTKKSPRIEQLFLDALTSGKSPTYAAQMAGISRISAYLWRNKDASFKKRWEEAVEAGVDKLEDEAHRRATDGTLRPVFQGGIEVGQVREYSDNLMTLMLRGRRSHVYNADRTVNLNDITPRTNIEEIDARILAILGLAVKGRAARIVGVAGSDDPLLIEEDGTRDARSSRRDG